MDQGVNLMIIGYYLQLCCLSEADPDTMIIQSTATPIGNEDLSLALSCNGLNSL